MVVCADERFSHRFGLLEPNDPVGIVPYFLERMRVAPKRARNRERVDACRAPPSDFIIGSVHFAVMGPA
jgi:hypothetical protein